MGWASRLHRRINSCILKSWSPSNSILQFSPYTHQSTNTSLFKSSASTLFSLFLPYYSLSTLLFLCFPLFFTYLLYFSFYLVIFFSKKLNGIHCLQIQQQEKPTPSPKKRADQSQDNWQIPQIDGHNRVDGSTGAVGFGGKLSPLNPTRKCKWV